MPDHHLIPPPLRASSGSGFHLTGALPAGDAGRDSERLSIRSRQLSGAIVIGGLLASTFFTLWVGPLAYTVIDDLSTAVRDTMARATAPRGGGRASEAGSA